MQVAEPVLLLSLRAPPSPPRPARPLALEERLVPLVDRLDLEIGLVPGELQVVLAADLLEEELRVPPVFVEIPGQRRLQR